MDIPAVTRDAFTLPSTAAALRKVGRTADALAFAERAERRLAEVLRGGNGLPNCGPSRSR